MTNLTASEVLEVTENMRYQCVHVAILCN